MKLSRTIIIFLAITSLAIISGIVVIVLKKQQDQKMNENVIMDELVQFKEYLQELGLSKVEIDELFERGEQFEKAKMEFDAQQDGLHKKYPEQFEQFVHAVSNAMFDFRFEESDPAIVALIHEPVVAQLISAWKHVHEKESELAQKHPEFKNFLAQQQEEILREIDEEVEPIEPIE